MSDNIRIRTTPGGDNNFLKVNINQKFDFIEILSLKISQNDAYKRFCSDYGVVVGRVIVNNGVGVPNAKVSVFIPIDEEDKLDPDIFGLYPFETVTDTNSDGIPYNLLPNNSKGKDDCFTVIGTFPSKREIQDNDNLSKIYRKYYKFTTTTNNSGDYMLFGLPVGTHFLHCEVDISDIGFLSQKPYELITQGGTANNFKSASKYKNRLDSTSLSQLKKFSPISVNVQPFWGDLDQCEVGITRNDIDLQFSINPSALFTGSIFTDSGKNTVTKKCLPRPRIGEHDQLSTGAGTVEMIRKTRNGEIERFDINGGEVIDDDGTWNYLIPMNLDYITTSEEGDLVPTNDPTKGIPTRTTTRFRIKIRNSNGAYLVPNNPENKASTDYSFDQSTKDESFVDIYWNEIYSVKNYIPRIQQTNANDLVEEFTGIKDVDSGSALQFPFNKIGININPLFAIICVFLNIFVLIVGLINDIIINVVNFVLSVINEVLRAICIITVIIGDIISVFGADPCDICLQPERCRQLGSCSAACNCDLIPYVPYIYLDCDGEKYVIGLLARLPVALQATQYSVSGVDPLSADACTNNNNTPINYSFYYVGNNTAPTNDIDASAGWLDCQARLLVESLNLIQFDFYNDWVNGTLYSFQFDISNDRNRFCDIDDTNNQFGPIKPPTFIRDTCTLSSPIEDKMNICDKDTSAGQCGLTVKTLEGIIKKFDDIFYYAPKSHSGNKFFATDIINLGSMVDCNWRGTPKIYPFLLDTSFNIPSLSPEREDPNDFSSDIIETGFDTFLSNANPYLVADIGCFPVAFIFTNLNSCVNIRRFCELGAGLDEKRGNGSPVNNRIDNDDVDAEFVRGAFAYLNGLPDFEGVKFDKITSSDFGEDNGEYYEVFRDLKTQNRLGERSSSFYFYFGLNKGKTSYDKILKNFFPECEPEIENDFVILGQVTQEDDNTPTPTGEIDIQIVNGLAPYDVTWTGPNQYSNNIINYQQDTQTISNLFVGTYNVTVIDSLNRLSTRSFYVPGPIAVNCSLQTTPLTTSISNDGEILVSIFNGTAPFSITLVDDNTGLTGGTVSNTYNTSNTFLSLGPSTYTVTVTDSLGTICERKIDINDLPSLQISASTSDVSCFGDSNGVAFLTILNGNAPFDIEWKDSSNNILADNVNALTSLNTGNYTVTVTDSGGNGNSVTQNFTISEPIDISYTVTKLNIGCKGDDTGEIRFSNVVSENSVDISYTDSNGTNIVQTVSNSNGSYNILNLGIGFKQIKIKDKGTGCEKIENINIEEPDNDLSINLVNTTTSSTNTKLDAIATDGWGDTPVGNPAPGNTYEFIWQVKTGGSYQTITNNPSIGVYSFTILNLIAQGKSVLYISYPPNSTGLDVRCRIKGINGNTGAFCEKITQPISI